MLGIDKETFIHAIQNADIKIITNEEIENLFCDLGKPCKYDYDHDEEVIWCDEEKDDGYDFDEDYIPKDPRH